VRRDREEFRKSDLLTDSCLEYEYFICLRKRKEREKEIVREKSIRSDGIGRRDISEECIADNELSTNLPRDLRV